MRALRSRWAVFFITVLVHGLATRGHALAASDTPFYVKLADGFRGHHLSDTFNLDAVRWTKTVYLVFLASARTVSPAHWMGLMVVLNVLCSGIVAVLLVDLAWRMGNSVLVPLFAFLAYLFSFEVIQWLPFVLTDLVFCAAAMLPFYLVARRLLAENEPRRTLLLVLALVLAVFTRPPGILLVPLVLFAVLVLIERRVSARVAAAVIILAAVTALSVRTAAVNDPALWPFRFVKPKIVEFSAREKTGEVILDRRESFRPPLHSAADHLVIVADRFVRFFQITTAAFSRAHNLFNLAWFLPIYGLGLTGAFYAFRERKGRRRAFVIALLMWVGLFAFLHALTVLDFDWRSRTPLIPQFILLAACGVDALAVRMRQGGAGSTR